MPNTYAQDFPGLLNNCTIFTHRQFLMSLASCPFRDCTCSSVACTSPVFRTTGRVSSLLLRICNTNVFLVQKWVFHTWAWSAQPTICYPPMATPVGSLRLSRYCLHAIHPLAPYALSITRSLTYCDYALPSARRNSSSRFRVFEVSSATPFRIARAPFLSPTSAVSGHSHLYSAFV